MSDTPTIPDGWYVLAPDEPVQQGDQRWHAAACIFVTSFNWRSGLQSPNCRPYIRELPSLDLPDLRPGERWRGPGECPAAGDWEYGGDAGWIRQITNGSTITCVRMAQWHGCYYATTDPPPEPENPETPKRRTVWINEYPPNFAASGHLAAWLDKDSAEKFTNSHRIACHEVKLPLPGDPDIDACRELIQWLRPLLDDDCPIPRRVLRQMVAKCRGGE